MINNVIWQGFFEEIQNSWLDTVQDVTLGGFLRCLRFCRIPLENITHCLYEFAARGVDIHSRRFRCFRCHFPKRYPKHPHLSRLCVRFIVSERALSTVKLTGEFIDSVVIQWPRLYELGAFTDNQIRLFHVLRKLGKYTRRR